MRGGRRALDGWAGHGRGGDDAAFARRVPDQPARPPARPLQFKSAYPALAALHSKVAAVPGVAAYLTSAQRFEKVNNNGLG